MSELLTESARRDIDDDSLQLFWEFITERQKTWNNRVIEGYEPPWTKDEILKQYRFTNVYRQLDPGTQYVIQNILEANADRKDKILNVMLYRLIGRLETHEFLGFQSLESFQGSEVEKNLKYKRDELEEPIFTGAYMVSGYNHMGSSDKVENVVSIFEELTSDPSFFEDVLSADSLEKAYNIIQAQPGFGNFLTYQVLVDLLYPVSYYNGDSVLPFSPDDWSSPGPGAQKGLDTLTTVDSYDDLEIMRWLHDNQEREFERFSLGFPFLLDNDGNKVQLSLADIQNCLCEFYKYDKILKSNGRARRCFRESEGRSKEELRSLYENAPNIGIQKMI